MTNHELCVKILEEMVELSYNLCGRTVDELADLMGNDVDLMLRAKDMFLKWKNGK